MKELIQVAKGEKSADLVLKGGNIVNVFTGEIENADIAIKNGKICGIGDYVGIKVIDCIGMYIMPSFIDAHMHIESTMLTPAELAKIIIPHGTTTIMADPHEIANVCGFDGIKFLYDECQNLPIDAHFMLPSCVPATTFEDSGAEISADNVKTHINTTEFFGLGEFMNYTSVINCGKEELKKLQYTKNAQKSIDGHACDVRGKELNAYLCGGINSDHECISPAEMHEKISRGMYIQVRQGSATQNLVSLLPAINAFTMRRCVMCTDDKKVDDLLKNGHIDYNIRLAIKNGLNPIWAITMATLNPAECYGLKGKGAIAPNYDADIAVVDNLTDFNVKMVFKAGKLIVKNNNALFKTSKSITPNKLSKTVNLKPISQDDLKIKLRKNKAVILELLPQNVITKKLIETVETTDGYFDYEKNPDINKLCVVERHKATGKVGLGLIKGYGIKNGAIAITVAHDSHNIIAVGDSDNDIITAINQIKRINGGMVISSKGKIIDELPLDIAGLISSKPFSDVDAISRRMKKKAYNMGINKEIEPFMSLSFLSLAVIPEIKLTARGLYDTKLQKFISIDPWKD